MIRAGGILFSKNIFKLSIYDQISCFSKGSPSHQWSWQSPGHRVSLFLSHYYVLEISLPFPLMRGTCGGISSKSGKDSQAERWYFDLKMPSSAFLVIFSSPQIQNLIYKSKFPLQNVSQCMPLLGAWPERLNSFGWGCGDETDAMGLSCVLTSSSDPKC